MELHDLIEKYRGAIRAPSSCDCLTLLLHYLGDEEHIEQIKGRYTTQRGAFRTIPKLTGYPTIEDYLETHCERIQPLFCRDGDIIVGGGHMAVIASGHIFGVFKDIDGFEVFGFKPLEVTALNKGENNIYRKR
ncbi:DUF6950 family protein [Aeromonas caviae]|uniref:DUF6950 family protein n=1 Tax=Aeromonas caviae TaxID=648 RepID=UPI002B46FFB2|nr:hypothetical protein [Aeromonas caviae]